MVEAETATFATCELSRRWQHKGGDRLAWHLKHQDDQAPHLSCRERIISIAVCLVDDSTRDFYHSSLNPASGSREKTAEYPTRESTQFTA